MDSTPPDNGDLPPSSSVQIKTAKTQNISIVLSSHKSTVILIELRWTFSVSENRLKSGISAILVHKRPPLQSNSAAGVYVFYGDCGFLHRCNR